MAQAEEEHKLPWLTREEERLVDEAMWSDVPDGLRLKVSVCVWGGGGQGARRQGASASLRMGGRARPRRAWERKCCCVWGCAPLSR